jgi:DNA invertase Pin-like site-specific DNA recombinase
MHHGFQGTYTQKQRPARFCIKSSPIQHHPWREVSAFLKSVFTQDERPVMWTRPRKIMKTTPDQFVTYYRVSTQRQGASGLGLDAQRQTVAQYLSGAHRTTVGEFLEVETGKGADPLSRRPQLRLALDLCKRTGATLLIAKLDRLARNVHFVSGLMESKVSFVACDLPEANQLTIHIMAAFAEHEARRISERTRDALAAAKARGVVLGATGPANLKTCNDQRQQKAQEFRDRLRPVLDGMVAQRLSRRAMVVRLNDLGIKAPMGGTWSLGQVQRLTKAAA